MALKVILIGATYQFRATSITKRYNGRAAAADSIQIIDKKLGAKKEDIDDARSPSCEVPNEEKKLCINQNQSTL